MKAELINTLTGLKAYNEETEIYLKKKKIGCIIIADIKEPRNYEFLKKFFALVKVGFNFQFQYKDFNTFRKNVIIATGRFSIIYEFDGSHRKEADSISFSKMNQATFADLYSDSMDVILEYLNNIHEKKISMFEIEEAILQFM